MNCPSCGAKLNDISPAVNPWWVCPSEDCEWRYRELEEGKDGEQG